MGRGLPRSGPPGLARFAFLDLSFRRFVEACRKRTYDDRVIDFSIAAESLFLVHADTELTNRLGQRASVWLGGDPAERDQHWKDFNEIYAARSKLVHGELWRPKGSQRQLDVLANLAGEHRRRALRLVPFQLSFRHHCSRATGAGRLATGSAMSPDSSWTSTSTAPGR